MRITVSKIYYLSENEDFNLNLKRVKALEKLVELFETHTSTNAHKIGFGLKLLKNICLLTSRFT